MAISMAKCHSFFPMNRSQFGKRIEGPYMDSPSLQAPFSLAPVPTAHVYSASDFGIASMQGHDGLFARGLPIASTCFSHMDI